MPVVTATYADLPLVQKFVRSAVRRQLRIGDEDLENLVAAGSVLLEIHALLTRPTTPSSILGLAAFYPEPRPPSLPAAEPDRVFLRAAAFRSGASPSATLHSLVDAWAEQAAQAGGRRLLIAYGGEAWYNRSLLASGFTLAEEVRFFALPHLARVLAEQAELPPAAVLRPAQPEDLPALAALDAACFDVLWHMGEADLRHLVLFGQVMLARVDDQLAGYVATTMREEIVQVARLGVHPDYHRRGIGRQLLLAGLRSAVMMGCRTAVLNTQANNERSQALYRSLGFHPTGEQFVVYTRKTE